MDDHCSSQLPFDSLPPFFVFALSSSHKNKWSRLLTVCSFFFNYITVLWVLNSLGLFSLCKIVQLFLVVNVSLYLFSVLFSVFIGRRFMSLLYTWTNLALTTLKDIRYNTVVQHSIDLFVTIFLRFNTLLSF